MKFTAALFCLGMFAPAALADPATDSFIQARGCVGQCWTDNNAKGFVKCVPECILGHDEAEDLSSSEEEDNELCSDKCFKAQEKDPNAPKTPGGFTAYNEEVFQKCMDKCYRDKGILSD